MSVKSLQVDFGSPAPIRLDFNLASEFPGKSASNITEVYWSLKRSDRDADNKYVLKQFTTGGVTKENITAENGESLVRFSVVLLPVDWANLAVEEYLLVVGFRLDSQAVGELSYILKGDKLTKIRILFGRRALTV
jgi:hypothetical protein